MPETDDRLQYLTCGEVREEIAYAVGGDPTRYGVGSSRNLNKAHLMRIAETLQPQDDDTAIHKLELPELYDRVCAWSGGVYNHNAGKDWGIRKHNLKRIHRALDARPPTEVVHA